MFYSIFVIFQLSQTAQIYKELTNDSISICVSSLNFILFRKLLSVDVVLKLKKFVLTEARTHSPGHSTLMFWAKFYTTQLSRHLISGY